MFHELVVVLKAARSEAGAASHDGAVAGGGRCIEPRTQTAGTMRRNDATGTCRES